MTVVLDPTSEPGLRGPLARFGDAPALVHDERVLSYAALDALVAERRARLGTTRRLVLLECANDVETVVSYLAATTGGHPVLLAAPGAHDDLVPTYQPDVVLSGDLLTVQRPGTAHDLHPDLALLLSTSGSTGSPKLVRLSHENVTANAAAIASYLGLTAADRAATTLPLHYCYGLSVLTSHLHVGASLLLTDASVVEDRLWDAVDRHGVTSFAGVPHTFDLLDASGFADRVVPSLRYVTQAGGRLAPERVRELARLGRRRGFDLFVMYGATEATARMAYLPPHLAESRPGCIGLPVPGGALRIEGTGDVGELVYAGPNVMMGYATSAADLALGRTETELRTGDLARRHADGLFEVVGRRSRFAKVFGLRIDLDRFERLADQRGVTARAVEHDGRLTVFVLRGLDVPAVHGVAAGCGLPPAGVRVHVVTELPVTSTGKPDHGALVRHAEVLDVVEEQGPRQVSAAAVRDELAAVLGRPDAGEDDSFVSLHGDSLSFVEASVRLGDLLGDLPHDWHARTARQLAGPASRRTPWAWVETTVALRAAAIVAIVASHADLVTVVGGAHVLLAVVGFQLARLQLGDKPRRERVRGLLSAAANVAAPSALFIAAAGLVTGMYDASTALFLNNVLGSAGWDLRWQFWFLEVVVWSFVATAALFALPRVDALERRHPFRFALAVLAGTAALRFVLVGVEAGIPDRYALPVVLWCVALGWAAARATTSRQRLVVAGAGVLLTRGFFADPVREAIVIAGVAVLLWVGRVPVPRLVVRPLSVVAAASLWVYLTHWQVYPHLEVDHPLLATLASFAVGIGCWASQRALITSLRRVARPDDGQRLPGAGEAIGHGRHEVPPGSHGGEQGQARPEAHGRARAELLGRRADQRTADR